MDRSVEVKRLIERYTAVCMQYKGIGRDEVEDNATRIQVNIEKMCNCFERLTTWSGLIPAKLMVFSENLLAHQPPPGASQAEKVKAAVTIPGPETDRVGFWAQ